MPHLRWSAHAATSLARLYNFLLPKNPAAADRAIEAIRVAAERLESFPLAGRAAPEFGEGVRQLPVHFSSSGYLLRYRIVGDTVLILAVKHMRERPLTGRPYQP